MSIFLKRAILLAIAVEIGATRLRTSASSRAASFEGSLLKPQVTSVDGKLVYASFLSYPESRIRFESGEIEREPCDVSFPTLEAIDRVLSFDSLGNGKLLLSLLRARPSYEEAVESRVRLIETLIVDLASCDTKVAITTLERSSGASYDWDYGRSLVVEPGRDEFDVFASGHVQCNSTEACRFRWSHEAVLIGKTDFERPPDVGFWSMRSVLERDFSRGFFYTVSAGGTTTLKILDQDLQTQEEKRLAHSSFLFSDRYGRVNRCYGISNEELECEFFDADLQRKSRVNIDTHPYRRFIRGMQLFNLEDGCAILMFVLQLYTEPTDYVRFSVHLHHLDFRNYGKIVRPFTKFYDDICKDFGNVKIMKLKLDLYCIAFSCKDTVHTKCLRASLY